MESTIVEKLERHFKKYKAGNYKKGAILIAIGNEPDAVFFLKEGYVKMSTVLANGNDLTMNIYKPGSLFPMFWALGDVPNNYSFEAMTNSKIYKAPKNEVIRYLKENPDVSFDLIKRILAGVEGLLTNYHHLLIGSADSRVSSVLFIAAKRFGQKIRGGTLIDLKLTHQDIANLAGISRETASVAIGKLTKGNIIKQTGRKFVILDMDNLIYKTDIYQEDSKNDPTIV